MDEPRVTLSPLRERPGFDNAQNLVTFTDITFTIDETGDTGTVSIPKDRFSAEFAHSEVMRRVNEIMSLRNRIGG